MAIAPDGPWLATLISHARIVVAVVIALDGTPISDQQHRQDSVDLGSEGRPISGRSQYEPVSRISRLRIVR